jgi:integrase/recombinase XerD
MTSPSHDSRLIGENDLFEYMNIVELSGISKGHKKEVTRSLKKYLDYIDWNIDKTKSLEYFKLLMNKCSIAYYKKQMYQIRKFLVYMGVEWINDIKLPSDPIYIPKRIGINDIHKTLEYFEEHVHYKQFKALIQLGASSGLRAEELYQLNIEDIDIDNRIVYVNHIPEKKQSTKTQRSRISFFNYESQKALKEYFQYFNNGSNLKTLFSQTHLTHQFRNAPIRVKQLRKFFSQEWDRRGGATSIKKILMGHSLKGDIDLQHYNAQSEEDLKRIYDKVMAE